MKHIPITLYNRRYRSNSIMTTPFTQRNSDCMFIILQEALSKYDYFHDNPEIRLAYDLGVKRLVRLYTKRYAKTFRFQDERGHSQFKAMMEKLKSLGYDTYKMERRVRLRYLYSIKEAIGRKQELKKFLKEILHLRKEYSQENYSLSQTKT